MRPQAEAGEQRNRGIVTLDPAGWRAWLRVLVNPGCWFQVHRYSEPWDRRLRDLMAAHDFKRRSDHTASIGGVPVWIANHPYGSMATYPEPMVRPSRRTMLMAFDRYIADVTRAEVEA